MSSRLSALIAANPKAGANLKAADGAYLYNSDGTGTDKSAGLLLGELAKALNGYFASSNASGNTTITPGPLAVRHLEVTAVTGAGATTRKFILATTTTPAAGTVVVHRVNLPATSGITLQWVNATSGGTVLTSFVSDASGDDLVAEFYFNGTAWQFLRFTVPANA